LHTSRAHLQTEDHDNVSKVMNEKFKTGTIQLIRFLK
jgi:hypothetical protein